MCTGGERNRLHLAKTLKQSGNLLLLDEPTNDLDVSRLMAETQGHLPQIQACWQMAPKAHSLSLASVACRLIWRAPQVATLRCLEEAIENFAGTSLIISHDR